MAILEQIVDLTTPDARDHAEAEVTRDPEPPTSNRPDPGPARTGGPVRGMRIRRIRLGSLARIAAVFFVLGYLTVIGTVVAVWSVAHALGVVDALETTVTSALGLTDPFVVAGSQLLPIVAVGAAVMMALGLALTVLLAFVYNVTCSVFGGLALDIDPLRRPRPTRS